MHQLDPIIHGADAAPVLRMPKTDTLCVDDLGAGATGCIADSVAATKPLAHTLGHRVEVRINID